MIIDYWTLLAIPIIVGVITLLIEYFVIHPLAKVLEKRAQENKSIINYEKEKKQNREPLSQKIKNKLLNSNLFKKSIEVLAKVSPKNLGLTLIIFCVGIAFSIFIARITGTNLAAIGIRPTNPPSLSWEPSQTPVPSPTQTPRPESTLARIKTTVYADILFVVNLSYGMNDEEVQQVQEALFEFGNRLLQDDNVGVITFSDEPKIAFPLSNVKNSSKEYLDAINSLQHGYSYNAVLNNAIIYSLDQFPINDNTRKKIVIVLTVENIYDTKFSSQAASNSIKSHPDVTVVFVGLGTELENSDLRILTQSVGTQIYTWKQKEKPLWINDVINTYLTVK